MESVLIVVIASIGLYSSATVLLDFARTDFSLIDGLSADSLY